MKIELKSFLIGGFSLLSFFLLSGQIYYKDDKIIEKLNRLNLNDEVMSSEINEIKAQIKHGFKVNGGYINEVREPVRVKGGAIDRVNNSVDCICYEGRQ